MSTFHRNGIGLRIHACVKPSVARGSSILLAYAATAFGSGCAARLYASTPSQAYVDDSFVYEETVPVNIETYPHYYYGDGYAYYVDGRWYRRGPRGWGYYRQEPPELERQRVYARPAPEAEGPRGRPYVQQAPEPQRERPNVRQVPEAPRERPTAQPAPPTPVPNRGAAEAQPRRDEPRRDVPRAEAPRPAPAPPAEKRPGAPHEDHAAPQREQRGP